MNLITQSLKTQKDEAANEKVMVEGYTTTPGLSIAIDVIDNLIYCLYAKTGAT
ncbi:hypothetical protein TWF481_003247 [Arthrobotrys musiformis]|uniref:Uncharacterized protein n=1 Tax=Arthrobotrys musiformis TaxID=47236 RepID=A0AAV9VRP1_9PEZI